MRLARSVVVAAIGVVLLAAANLSAAQSAEMPSKPQAEVTFQFEREGLPVPRFLLRVREDGTGRYQAEQSAKPSSETSMRGEPAQHIDRTLNLSPAMAAKIFHAAHALDRFNVVCASKAKNIANTGIKTLTYSGPAGSGSCTYNYTENKMVMMLTDIFIGIAATMDEGRRLEFVHRYDRLGLDEEMNDLSQEVAEGRALELGTIASTLSAIAADTAVIERVRVRASRLLDQAQGSR